MSTPTLDKHRAALDAAESGFHSTSSWVPS